MCAYHLTPRDGWLGKKALTLNKLALVPIMNPVWSKKVVHAVVLAGWPLVKCVPA